jgi:membrane-associated phospholipid phosphatase
MRFSRPPRDRLTDKLSRLGRSMRNFYRFPPVNIATVVGVAVVTVLLIALDPVTFPIAKWISDTDIAIARFVTANPEIENGLLRRASQWVTVAFTLPPILLMAFAAWSAGRMADRPNWSRFGGVLLRAGLAQIVVTELVKRTFGRVRPSEALELGAGVWQDLWLPTSSHQSFPSGHAAFALVFVLLTIAYFPRARRVWICTGAAIILARWFLLRHYASDLWLGAWLGAFVGATFARSYPPLPDELLRRLRRRREDRVRGARRPMCYDTDAGCAGQSVLER